MPTPPPPPPIPTFSYTALSNFGWWFGLLQGARDGTVLRALASHQCGPGSNPSGRRHMWVEFVVGSLLCSERFFFSATPVFPSPQKPKFPNSNSTRHQVDEEPICGCVTSKSLLFHYFVVKTISNTKLNRKPGLSSRKCRHVDHHLFIYKFIKMIYKKWFRK